MRWVDETVRREFGIVLVRDRCNGLLVGLGAPKRVPLGLSGNELMASSEDGP